MAAVSVKRSILPLQCNSILGRQGKVILILEPGKFWLVDSGIPGFGFRNTAQGIRNSANALKSGIPIPLSKNLEFNTGIQNPLPRVRNPRLSLITYPEKTAHISLIWVVLLILISRAAWEICFNQLEARPRSGKWRVISMEFLCSFLRRHFAGKPVVTSWNVGWLLKLPCTGRPRDIIKVARLLGHVTKGTFDWETLIQIFKFGL